MPVGMEMNRRELDALLKGKPLNAVKRALRKAGATAIRDMRSETSKRVRKRKRIKAKAIRDSLRLRKAKGARIQDMEWAVDISGKPIRLVDYPHKQRYELRSVKTKSGISQSRAFGAGVVVEVNRGKKTLIKPAFIATMKSGHRGIFLRRGLKRLPIEERFGSRVIDAVLHKGEIPAIQQRGQDSFANTFARVLPIEIERRT